MNWCTKRIHRWKMKTIRTSIRPHCLARMSIFLTAAALIVGMAGCAGCGQPRSQNLEIRTWYDLDAVRDNLAGHHTLMNDLDSTTPGYEELAGPTADEGRGWYPIGIFSQGSVMEFIGTLDGQGHEIRDLFIDRPDPEPPNHGSAIGLIGVLGQRGVVENIGVVNVTVIGTYYVGGLVAYSGGTVSKSYCTGKVTGLGEVGGLVGCCLRSGTVGNSFSTASVNGSHSVGGLVGALGTLLHPSYGTISDSYSAGTVTGERDVGGLVGLSYRDTVSNCFWDTEASGQAASCGGTGKTTAQMKNVATFSGVGWNIVAIAPNETDVAHIWNIVDGVTYPFLAWQL
jgi:hypothetical protein